MMMMRRKILRRRAPNLNGLDELIRNQDWDAVRDAIHSPRFRILSGACKDACRRPSSSSPLALAVSLNPPSDVVDLLLRRDPAAVLQPDHKGRLPLHVACSTGASVEVVRLLLFAESLTPGKHEMSSMGNVNTALCADADNRVPLHYAAEYSTGSHGDTIDVFSVLCAACPEAASVKDAWGETPGDVAAQMKETAFLDGDHEMVEAGKAARRALLQTSKMQWQRKSFIKKVAKTTEGEENKSILVILAKLASESECRKKQDDSFCESM